MKEFMFLYRGGDQDWMKNASEEEMQAKMAKWGEWMAKLEETEQLSSGGSPLNFSGKRLSADGVVTDIAASELKEIVSGYSVVKANTIDDAIELARICPIFDYPGCKVEIREVPQMGSCSE